MQRTRRFVMSLCAALAGLAAALPAPAEDTRDPWLWPFAADSVWNTPIGDGAVYAGEGHFAMPESVRADEEWHLRVPAGSPERKLFRPGPWTNRAAGKRFLRMIRLPDDLIIDSARPGYSPNDCTALLMPDGKTLEQLGPLARFEVGGPAWGIPNPFFGGTSLYGPGVKGGHWGSGMSSIGGSLRQGDLTGRRKIRHALKVNVYCRRFLHYDADDKTPGYRWPAITADKYADHPKHGYGGKNPKFEMGALLAISPRHSAESLSLKTPAGRILMAALQDYGAYIVDDCSNDAFVFCAGHEATGEFREHFGYDFHQSKSAKGRAGEWYSDVAKLAGVLSVVDNNAPDSVGGGGKRRAPVALPFGTLDTTAPTIPANLRAFNVRPTRLELQWSAATDNRMMGGYEIWHGRKLAARTFGKTTAAVTSLPAGRSVRLRIRARDLGGNYSAFSSPLLVETPPLPRGTIVADFDTGEAPGWKLGKGARLVGKHLEIASWKGACDVLCEQPQLSDGGFTMSAEIRGVAGAANNHTLIYFRRSSDGKAGGVIQMGGGKSPVKLIEVSGGRKKTLASAKNFDADRIELQCTSDDRLSLFAIRGESRTRLIESVPMQLPNAGAIGFGARYNTVHIDRVRVTPTGAGQ